MQENPALSLVEGDLGVLWICGRNCEGTIQVSIGETDLLLRFDGKIGIPLKSKQENRPSSQDEVGNMGFFSSCGGKLGVPLKSSPL